VDRFDCVLSIEVAEHIPSEFESTFLDNLEHANKAFLSWALPDQAGTGHVNCLKKEEVRRKMEARGWTLDEEVTDELRTDSKIDYIRKSISLYLRNV